MTKQAKTVLADKVLEIKTRLSLGIADGAILEASSRLSDLRDSLEDLKDSQNSEIFRHFPVAAIATLEAHFRATVALIIDEGGQYVANGMALFGDRIKASEIMLSIHKKAVTIGELVAYSLPFSALSHLENVYDELLGQGFKQLSKSAIDPYFLRNKTPNAPLIVSDVSSLWSDLHQTFSDRHILAHESATKFSMDYEKAKVAIESVSLIIAVTDAILWSTVLKDQPLTQSEMNTAAWEKFKISRTILADKIREKRRNNDSKEVMARFRKLHFRWKAYVSEWCRYSADRYWGGSIQPLIEASELLHAYEDRIRQIENVTVI